MFLKIFSDKFSFMRFGVVDEEQVFFPSLSKNFKKSDKLPRSLSLVESEDKSFFATSTKDIRVLVGMIDRHDRMASSSCPSALNDRDEPECRFILCAHNKPLCTVILRFPPTFFLNCSIISLLGRL